MNKSSIRKQKIELRQALTASEHQDLSKQICAKLGKYLQDHKGIVAIYYPCNNEVDILALKCEQICLPVIDGTSKILKFRAWRQGEDLKISKYKIPQPLQTAEQLSPDIIIVPIVAFDKNLHRIGYGGGYYDATLQDLRKHKNILTIGVGFDFQETPKIQGEEHDQKLDVIITQSAILKP